MTNFINKKRRSSSFRETKETKIDVEVNIDGKGEYNIRTPEPFITHMLEQLSKHSLIDIKIDCNGDTEIDAHHTFEDIGLVLGKTISDALLNRKGIKRYFSIDLPMDDTLTSCSIDISGRPYLVWKVFLPNQKIGNVDADIFKEFFLAFANSAKFTIHIENKYGDNTHHIIESCFKSLAVCLKNSLTIDPLSVDIIPSTKGSIN